MQNILIFIFKIVIIIYPFYWFYIAYWVKQMETQNKLIFKFGKMGVGKTSDIVISGQKDLKNGWKHIYSSVEIPNFHYFDPKRIAVDNKYSFAPYSSVYIDEASLIFHARDFKNFPKELRTWLAMIRQQHIKVTIYSQSPNIDKAIRDLCHEYHILKRIGPFLLDQLISKKIDIGEDSDGNGNLVDAYYKVPFVGGLEIHYLPRVVGIFQSFDPPQYNVIPSKFIVKNNAYERSLHFGQWSLFHLKRIIKLKIESIKLFCTALQEAVRSKLGAIASKFF